jgi:hypothetical protein
VRYFKARVVHKLIEVLQVVAKPDIAKQGVALALTIAVGDSARGLVCSAANRIGNSNKVMSISVTQVLDDVSKSVKTGQSNASTGTGGLRLPDNFTQQHCLNACTFDLNC